MADRIFRVVLEQPTLGTKDGTLRLRFGSTPAQRLPGYTDSDFGDIGRNGAAANIRTTLVQERPGKPIWYPAVGSLVAGDPTLDHVDNVPEAVVKHCFGDWDYPEENLYNDQRLTKNHEKTRISMAYSGYETVSVRVGKNFADLVIGPPKVPHVACHEMDQRGALTGFVFRPWQFFGWDQEQYQKDPTEVPTPTFPHQPVTTVSADDLARLQAQIASLEKDLKARDVVRESIKKTGKRGSSRKIQIATEMPHGAQDQA
jgi:hypothetical protein